MKSKFHILLTTLISIILFTNCNKEKELQLYPIASLSVKFNFKDYGKKVSTSKEETLPPNFRVSITIKGPDVPQRTFISSTEGNPNIGYNLVSPIEAPFNKPFSITISTQGDSTTWEGSQSNIILEESRLPFQTSLTLGITSIMDIDGNIYKTVSIGSRLWMASNLKVTHYRNREAITYIPDEAQWIALGQSSGYCNLNNDNSKAVNYGRLYKYSTIVDSRGLCPSGWYVPTQTDWDDLAIALGGTAAAGGAMKLSGTSEWASPNVGADNSSGFSAYPSLSRDLNGIFDNQAGSTAIWWTSTFIGTGIHYTYSISYNSSSLSLGSQDDASGLAIRCIK